MPNAARKHDPQPYCRLVLPPDDPEPGPVTRSCVPFADIVDIVLPLLEQRAYGPTFCCNKCRCTWSANQSHRASQYRPWWGCPNGCDDVNTDNKAD
jgi:hypothetical protein